MESYLFGSGVPKFTFDLGGPEEAVVNILNSFIENIRMVPNDIEQASIINENTDWEDINAHNRIVVTVLCRLHKIPSPLTWWKNFYNNYNKKEVDAFFPSQTADPFVDVDGNLVKFRIDITELFPLRVPWVHDTFRIILRSKKPVNLGSLQVTTGEGIVQMDSSQSVETDTDQVAQTD